jgi:hypothetical protein
MIPFTIWGHRVGLNNCSSSIYDLECNSVYNSSYCYEYHLDCV